MSGIIRTGFASKMHIEEEIRRLERQVSYDIKEYTIEVLINKLQKEEIFIPDFQRNYVWTKEQAARFIESILLNIPIPFLFCADCSTGDLEIIDGAQRLTSLKKFYEGHIPLSNLEKIQSLSGETFQDLPDTYKKRFLNRTLRIIVLAESVDMTTRLDLFNRINTSSTLLTDSELRKGAFAGKFYDFVIEMAADKQFIKLAPIGNRKTDRGEREELVLRFFAYSEDLPSFTGRVNTFLNNYLMKNKDNTKDLLRLKNNFKDMLAFIEKNISHGFAKTNGASSTPRVRFEALSLGVAKALLTRPDLKNRTVDFSPLLESESFKKATTSDGSNTPARLNARINIVNDYLLSKIK